LAAAAKIQHSLLPHAKEPRPGLDVAWIFRPCDELGGDCLNVVRIDDEHYALYLLDVVGHGVPAALLSVTLSRLLSPATGESVLVARNAQGEAAPQPPAEVCRRLNERFQMRLHVDQFFTLFFGTLNVRTGRLKFASAGHPSPIVATAAGDLCVLPVAKRGYPIGVLPDGGCGEEELILSHGDRVFVYSDGLADMANPAGERFGEDRILSALRRRASSLAESLEMLHDHASDWSNGRAADDDVSVLALELRNTLPDH
jgi:sigma-B regulation protein RsbU (phosphoserine phosphatase)